MRDVIKLWFAMQRRNTHTIDATSQPLGRLAARIAVLLRGKNKPFFAPNKDVGDFVRVKNVVKIKFTGKKFEQKVYFRYSGYPGGLKKRQLKELFQRDPALVLRRAVYGMLPKNKLRAQQIKRLKFI